VAAISVKLINRATRQISIRSIRDAASTEHAEIIARLLALPDIKVINVYDLQLASRRAKISIAVKLRSRAWQIQQWLAYLGVGWICNAIAQDPEQVHKLTISKTLLLLSRWRSANLRIGKSVQLLPCQ